MIDMLTPAGPRIEYNRPASDYSLSDYITLIRQNAAEAVKQYKGASTDLGDIIRETAGVNTDFAHFTPEMYNQYQTLEHARIDPQRAKAAADYNSGSGALGKLGALAFGAVGTLVGGPVLGGAMAGAVGGLSSSPSADFGDALKGAAIGGATGWAGGQIAEGLGGYNPTGAAEGVGGLGTAGHAIGDAVWAPGVSGAQAGTIQGISNTFTTNNLLTQLGKELVTSTITGKDFSLGNVGTNLITSGVSNVAGNVMPSADGSLVTEAARAGVSGTAGGLISAARGGEFSDGFTSGAVSQLTGDGLSYATGTGPILTGDTAKSVIGNTSGAVGQIAIGMDPSQALTGAGAGILGDLAGSYVKDLNLTGSTLINDALGTGAKQAVGGLINSTYSNDTVPLVPDDPITQVNPPSANGGVGGFGRMTKDFTGGGLDNFESTAIKKTRGTA